MNSYRHNRVPGQPYLFTVHLRDPNSTLLTEHISAFGEAIRKARGQKPFHVDAWVVLHNHAHAIWTLPPGDHDCASRWRAVKIAFSKAVHKCHLACAGGAIWQPQYTQRFISNDTDYCALVDFVHDSPVSAGLCHHRLEWPWSSVHRFVAEGHILAPAPYELRVPVAWADPGVRV